MRLICKYHTQQPNMDVQTLVQEACMTLNSILNDGLGGRLSPKDIHFSHPPANFLPPLNDDGAEELDSARLQSKEVTLPSGTARPSNRTQRPQASHLQ